MHVLIVDDEQALCESIRSGLEAEGYTVATAHDGNTGFQLAVDGDFSVIVLDIMLPGRNGYRVCGDLRKQGISTPILMLTAKQGELDEAEALDTGADDFLSKPFSFVVLLARLRALSRRRTSAAVSVDRIVRGDLTADIRQRRCWRGDTEVFLTARELDLLAAIALRSPDPISKNELLDSVWGTGFDGDPNVVEVYVGYLRKKVDIPFGRSTLTTVRSVGYRLDADK